MSNLFGNHDGANAQARAVLAYLSSHDGIENSWDKDLKRYMAEPEVSRWHNCREQGYVVSLRYTRGMKCRQVNIAFFEHRNSDSICAIEWEQYTINPPTIDTADFGGKVYKDKWDVSHTVNYGRASEMADWVFQRLSDFWDECVAKTE